MADRNSEKVFEYLKQSIMNNKWKEGERITPEIQLAKELGVGRNAVREAIEKLVGMQILIKKKGKGTYINSNPVDYKFNQMYINAIVNRDDYMDILIFRKTFEPENVKMFIKNADENDYKELEKQYQLMEKYKDDREKFSYHDAQFHNILAKGTKNTIIIKISEILGEMMISHQKNLNSILGSESGVKEHKLLLEVIKDKDTDLAFYFMRKHITRTIKDIEKTARS